MAEIWQAVKLRPVGVGDRTRNERGSHFAYRAGGCTLVLARASGTVSRMTGHTIMRHYITILAFTAAIAAVAGCARTPGSPLDARPAAAPETADKTLRRAAEATLARGFTHFRLQRAAAASESPHIAGTPVTGKGAGSGFVVSGRAPIFRAARTGSYTIEMFRANDPRAAGAFDARAVLAAAGG